MIEKSLLKDSLVLRVPEITLIFWVIKTLSTTVGETAADYLSGNLGFGMPLVAIFMSIIMGGLLFLQFKRLKKYTPNNYWSLVVLMSIVGTLITDILVDSLGVSLVALSVVFTSAMIGGFVLWYKKEGTLSIHSINTQRREAYYWFIILLAFALGTGVGDLLSERLALGYDLALVAFSGAMVLLIFAYYALKLNATWAFWIAFILTRPLGASLGDFLTQPINAGGLNVNMLSVNTLFFIVIIGLVGYLNKTRKDILLEENK